MAARIRPDVVLLDIGLPGTTGYDVARQIREAPDLAHVLIIATTGFGSKEDQQRSRAAGFDHHLTKPLDLDVLRRLLASAPPER